jgi:hypothetical protein
MSVNAKTPIFQEEMIKPSFPSIFNILVYYFFCKTVSGNRFYVVQRPFEAVPNLLFCSSITLVTVSLLFRGHSERGGDEGEGGGLVRRG